MRPAESRKPTFVSQALLFLLPVGVIVAVGVWALRQNRTAVERQARNGAETLASLRLSEFAATLQPVKFAEVDGKPTVQLPAQYPSFSLRADNSLDQAWPFFWPPQASPLPTNLAELLQPECAPLWQKAETAFQAKQWREA